MWEERSLGSRRTDVRAAKSGRQDLNLRPLRPERSALAKLSYSPMHRKTKYNHRGRGTQVLGCETKSFCAKHHAEPESVGGSRGSQRTPTAPSPRPASQCIGLGRRMHGCRGAMVCQHRTSRPAGPHRTPGPLRNAAVPGSSEGRRAGENSQLIWIWRCRSPVLWGLAEAPGRGLRPTDKQVRGRALRCASLLFIMTYTDLRQAGFVCGPSWADLAWPRWDPAKSRQKKGPIFLGFLVFSLDVYRAKRYIDSEREVIGRGTCRAYLQRLG